MVACKFFQAGYCRYGQSCRFDHVYGSKYSYRASQSTGDQINQNSHNNQTTNINTANSFNNAAASIFRSAVQSPPQNQSVFGQNAQNRFFDRLSTQQNVLNVNNQAKSIFAQASQTHFSPPNNNFFTQKADPKSFFAQASQNVFGQNQQTQQNIFAQSPPQQRQNPSNVFANAAATLFKDVEPSPTGNIFQISEKPVHQPFDTNFDCMYEDDAVFSKCENLSKRELEAFQSDSFKLGHIPDVPPPKSLCV